MLGLDCDWPVMSVGRRTVEDLWMDLWMDLWINEARFSQNLFLGRLPVAETDLAAMSCRHGPIGQIFYKKEGLQRVGM